MDRRRRQQHRGVRHDDGAGSSKTVAQAGSCEIGAPARATPSSSPASPGTRYYYRLLVNGTPVLSTTYFETFPHPDSRPLFFTIVGDFGAGSSDQTNVANNQNAADPPLVVTVGDNAYENGTQSDWDNNVFIPQYENLLRRAVFMPTLGNHDLNDVGASSWASSVEIKMHLLPRNALAGQEERYYSFRLRRRAPRGPRLEPARARLDAGQLARRRPRRDDAQVEVRLSAPRVALSCANGIASFGSNTTVKNLFGPLFEQYGVDVVFEGHDHIYERSKPVDEFPGRRRLGLRRPQDDLRDDRRGRKDARQRGEQRFRAARTGSRSSAARATVRGCRTSVRAASADSTAASRRSRTPKVEITEQHDARRLDDRPVEQRPRRVHRHQRRHLRQRHPRGQRGPRPGLGERHHGSCCTASCAFTTSGTTCRASAGVCDTAETCSGSSALCPSDAKSTAVCRGRWAPAISRELQRQRQRLPGGRQVANGTVCRASAGTCDVAESCDGVNGDVPRGRLRLRRHDHHRAASGACDLAEACTGSSARVRRTASRPAGTTCRGSTGGCDPVEVCNGSATTCPADVISSAGTVCRAAASVCDVAETCNGSSGACPADVVAPSGTVCRASAGVCDVAESCNGVSGACPADGFVAGGTQCRASAG